jgi:glucose/arabinose dehydrogenase
VKHPRPTTARPRAAAAIALACALGLIVSWALPAASAGGSAQSALPPLDTIRVAAGLSQPIYVTAPANDGRLFIVEQGGLIRVVSGGVLLPTPFLDVTSLVISTGERGLLGLTFPANYASSGLFYVNYTRTGDGATVIARYRVSANPNVANAASAEILLTIEQPAANHNGGHLAFGPDGYLYIGMGDGGGGGDPNNHAQRDDSLLGKMLRIDVSGGLGSGYSIPPTNPHVGPGDPPDEIWANGLRNPYRWSFDRATGDMYIGDVGQMTIEEISFQPAGAAALNYGWRLMEGAMCFNPDPEPNCDNLTGLELPIHEYTHDDGRCSVTGGYVYRGAIPGLQGRYFFADFCTGEIWSFNPTLGAVDLIEHTAALQPAAGSIGNVGGFGEDGFGELYIVDRAPSGNGEVYKIVTPVSGYLLDGFGGLHPLGGAPAVSPSPPYFGFDAAEDVELSGGGGYVLDAFGGVHARGAPVLSPATPYFGFDVARDVELAGSGYYVLDAFGGVHRGGGAPAITAPTPYFGFNVARDLEVASTGYYVLDGFGGVHRGNGAAVLPPATPYFGFDTARDLELAGTGYYVLDGFGRVHAGGGASPILVPTPLFSFDIARDLELTAPGFYVLDGFGGIHAGGGAVPFAPPAPFFGFDIARDLELR